MNSISELILIVANDIHANLLLLIKMDMMLSYGVLRWRVTQWPQQVHKTFIQVVHRVVPVDN